jgi:pimeloyl-ACP methyl ester carboxylesterase
LPPETRYAKSGDVHVAYQVFGRGAVDLVFVPGFISNVEHYWLHPSHARWLNRLARFARVISFDKRGTGLSDRVSTMPSMDERMDDVRAVMDAAGSRSAALLGVSEGGSLAALFAATHPERCRALVLYGAFPEFRYWFPTRERLERFSITLRRHGGPARTLRSGHPPASTIKLSRIGLRSVSARAPARPPSSL